MSPDDDSHPPETMDVTQGEQTIIAPHATGPPVSPYGSGVEEADEAAMARVLILQPQMETNGQAHQTPVMHPGRPPSQPTLERDTMPAENAQPPVIKAEQPLHAPEPSRPPLVRQDATFGISSVKQHSWKKLHQLIPPLVPTSQFFSQLLRNKGLQVLKAVHMEVPDLKDRVIDSTLVTKGWVNHLLETWSAKHVRPCSAL